MSSELKPCPFCGSEPEGTRRAPSLPRFFECPNKCASAWGIDQWNRRSVSPAVKALVEAAKNAAAAAYGSIVPPRSMTAIERLESAIRGVEREIGGK